MLTSLQKMVGLPVIWQDRQMGYVERAVPNASAKRLGGIVVRRGLGAAKWLSPNGIAMVGEQCVLINQKPGHMPDGKECTLARAYLTTGECIGEVTDAVIEGGTLGLVALEISGGPFYRLMGRKSYAAEFRVCEAEGRQGGVVVPKLISWADLERSLREEEGK